MKTDTPQTGSKKMKFPDVVLVCSIAFAAGMVVPFAFFQLNSSTNRASVDVIGEYANAIPV
ncbi:MAG: hypothetical protein HKN28_17795 [Alphaproteobacteria bacterium]|nr:hypothetical protein [Alphaproteobacteria bacterium]